MTFSDRIGVTKPPEILQIDHMDDDLKTSLWNVIFVFYSALWEGLAKVAAIEFFKYPLDQLENKSHAGYRQWIKERFFTIEWYDVYNFIEFIVETREKRTDSKRGDLIAHINSVLERERSGYHFINGIFVPISNEAEVREVEEAITGAAKGGLTGAHEQLQSALRLFGQKPDPDYRNAIKEAISAIESVAKRISGVDSGGLKLALNKLAKATNIHPALKSAFLKLYGYTSDENGIRHAILDEVDVGFHEAKFMIVACSAFVNYLIAKADAVGMLRNAR